MVEYRASERKVVSEEVKRRIVQEVESGRIGQCEAARTYGISRTSIMKWLRQYGTIRYQTRIVEVVMADEKAKISELQQALSDAHLKLRLYEKMIELAGKEYQTDLKKNFSTQALELLSKKAAKSKDSVG